MKILITGATGFIGNAVAHRLADEGHSVRCLVRPTSDTKSLSDIVWDKVVGDISSMDDCREAVRGMEAVIHCAAMATDFGPIKAFREINVNGTQNLAEAALGNKVSRFVYISTNDVLGIVKGHVIDDTFPYKPTGFPYSDTKIEAEQNVFELFRKRNLPLVALRPAWVYGPGDRTFLPELVTALDQGALFYIGSRHNVIFLNYIDNLVDAVMLALTHPDAVGRAYLVTDGVEITWEQLCSRLATGLNIKSQRWTVPFGVAMAAATAMELTWKVARSKSRPMLTRYAVTMLGSNLKYDDTRIRKELGYFPRIFPDEGIRRSIKWIQSQEFTSRKKNNPHGRY